MTKQAHSLVDAWAAGHCMLIFSVRRSSAALTFTQQHDWKRLLRRLILMWKTKRTRQKRSVSLFCKHLKPS